LSSEGDAIVSVDQIPRAGIVGNDHGAPHAMASFAGKLVHASQRDTAGRNPKVVGTVTVPGTPEFMVYDESTDRIYLNLKDKDVVAVIDPLSNKLVDQWSTSPASRPHGMALDQARHQIFSAGANGKLVAIDTRTGALASSVAITPKVDQIAFDVAGGIVYCAGAGQMSVVRASGDKLTLLANVRTAATARNVAVDPTTRAVWTTFTDGKSSFAKSWKAPGS
jgi:DNA-binding beta-propeller fold protein YncE